jgi:hypothetical protein
VTIDVLGVLYKPSQPRRRLDRSAGLGMSSRWLVCDVALLCGSEVRVTFPVHMWICAVLDCENLLQLKLLCGLY